MVYLTIFLSLLISILIYAVDIVPSRSTEDIRVAGSYIVDFVNQHQAAKDFVYHWLGHVDPNAAGIVKNDGSSAIRLDNLEDFMTVGSVKGVAQTVPLLSPVSENRFDIDESGGYKSAYICIKADGTLASCTSGTSKGYVITYGEKPDWWTRTEGKKRSVDWELWRRAIVQRTHGSYNCGTLTFADPDHPEHPTLKWCYKKGRKHTIRAKPSCDDGEIGGLYCIDNGQGCATVVPDGIGNFVDDAGSGEMFCMSPAESPYVKDGLVFNYDGIDNLNRGAPTRSRGAAPRTWVGAPGTTLNLGSGVVWTESDPAIKVAGDGIVINGRTLGDAREFTITVIARVERKSGPVPLIGPLLFYGRDVQLANGTSVGLSYLTQCNDPSHEILQYDDCFGLLYRDTDGETAQPFVTRYFKLRESEETTKEVSMNNNTFSWTIVKRNVPQDDGSFQEKLFWYGDGAPICGTDASRRFSAVWQPSVGGTRANLKIGGTAPGDGPLIYAVRYYNRALSRKEIMKNFKADVKRYNLGRWDNDVQDGGGEYAVYNITSRQCESECDTDDDCLTGTCEAGQCAGYTPPEYISR